MLRGDGFGDLQAVETRTFVSNLLDAGIDIAPVVKMAGHSNIQTTARYGRRPEDAKQRAATVLHTPYAGLAAQQEKQYWFRYSAMLRG
ncbi:MAG: site-specific integrase [Chloroflexi bacterium]|nr:MAG: site-specific integrase [Chloroflexota bacterium]